VGAASFDAKSWQNMGVKVAIISHLTKGKITGRIALTYSWTQRFSALGMDDTRILAILVFVDFQ
jgi:hypothetical protein